MTDRQRYLQIKRQRKKSYNISEYNKRRARMALLRRRRIKRMRQKRKKKDPYTSGYFGL